MNQAPKDTSHHFITEVTRLIEERDLAREFLGNSKMPGAPGNFIAKPEQSGSNAGDGMFISVRRRGHVRCNATRKIETELARCLTVGRDANYGEILTILAA